MNRFTSLVICYLLLTSSSSPLRAQGTQADYARMNAQSKLGQRLVDRREIDSFWLTDDRAMWYRVDTSTDQTEYHLVLPNEKQNRLLFTSSDLRDHLDLESSPKTNLRKLQLKFDTDLTTVFFKIGSQAFRFSLDSTEFSLIASKEIPVDNQPKFVLVQPSGGSTENATLTIRNNTSSRLQVFWIDPQLRPRKYDDLPAGKSHSQGTYIGHHWLLRNEAGKNVALLECESDGQVFEVTNDKAISLRIPDEASRMRGFYLRGNPDYTPEPNRRRTGRRTATSPDGLWKAKIKDYNVFLTPESINGDSPQEIQLTEDGSKGHFYSNRIYWSPDSKHLVVIKEEPAEEHLVYTVESSPTDQLQPKLHTNNYLKPGDRIRKLQPVMFSMEQKQQVKVENQLFSNPWELYDFRWLNDSSEFHFRYNQRGHQVMRVVGIAPTGTTRTVVEDVSKTFIDYTNKVFSQYINDEQQLIWASERDGMNHLYLIDVSEGKILNQITQGPWLVRKVSRVDTESKKIWFSASGVYPDQDPYHVHFGVVNFDGTGLTWLTDGDGNHSIDYSPTKKFIVDTFSRVDLPPVRQLRNAADGQLICELEAADLRRLIEAGWQPPERFSAKGRDGETDIHGVIYRPQNFDPAKRYPVIEYIYAGPHDAFVPKSFGPNRREKSLAELGFIVVQIDGMGTNHRGKVFHDVCWQNLGDSGFPDRILWMKAAARRYPQLDIERVGIYGGSAGGQSSTRAVLAYGDFYKAAVSDCGCHDNRMDKIWWNEQWMGWPIGDHYKDQSNVTQAHRLEGKLMLMVGELDRNVDPASTMQVVNALIQADKDFDLVVFPGRGHGAGSSRYGWRRTCDFFVRHLLDVEPRAN